MHTYVPWLNRGQMAHIGKVVNPCYNTPYKDSHYFIDELWHGTFLNIAKERIHGIALHFMITYHISSHIITYITHITYITYHYICSMRVILQGFLCHRVLPLCEKLWSDETWCGGSRSFSSCPEPSEPSEPGSAEVPSRAGQFCRETMGKP